MNATTNPQRNVWALVGAGVLVTVVVILVLVLGIARPPALASLEDAATPAPATAVAWTSYDRDASCIYVARPDGSVDELACDLDGGEVWAWDDDGIVVQRFGPAEELTIIDPVTADTVEVRRVDPSDGLRPASSVRIASRHEDGTLTVRRGDTGEVVWEVDAPEGYRVNDGALSPDGGWIVLTDSVERLLVVPADGSSEPRLWAEDVATWQAPVWEGTTLQRDG